MTWNTICFHTVDLMEPYIKVRIRFVACRKSWEKAVFPVNKNLVMKFSVRIRCYHRKLLEARKFSERKSVLRKGLNARGNNKKEVEIWCLVIPGGIYCFNFLFYCKWDKYTRNFSFSVCAAGSSEVILLLSQHPLRITDGTWRPVSLLLMEHSQLRLLYKYSRYWK